MNENRGIWRGKRINNEAHNGEWVEGLLYPVEYTGFNVAGGTDYYIIAHTDGGKSQIQVDPATLGECTGLPDFNGTLAFESDLVKIKGLDVTGVIRYGDYRQPFNDSKDTTHIGFYVDWLDEHSKAFFRVDLGYWLPQVEIIGNIHDNTELMQEGAAE